MSSGVRHFCTGGTRLAAFLGMETPNNVRHLYYDQQVPFEEPEEPAHAQVTTAMFAKAPPTAEDRYFLRGVILLERRGASGVRPVSWSVPLREDRSSGERSAWWARLTRFLTRSADLRWRP